MACGGGDGERLEPFSISAAPVISAGWRWARAWHPGLYAGWRHQSGPGDYWARLTLQASDAMDYASAWHAQWCRAGWGTHLPGREDSPAEAHARRLYATADRLRDREMQLWLSPQVSIVIDFTGLALMVAVYLEREERFAAYLSPPP